MHALCGIISVLLIAYAIVLGSLAIKDAWLVLMESVPRLHRRQCQSSESDKENRYSDN